MFSKDDLNEIKVKRQDWEKTILAKFLNAGELKEKYETSSGISIHHIYDPEDLKTLDFIKEIGYPGSPPFTRGIYPTMYRGRLWTTRQYAGYGSATETNKRFKYLISKGQKGLSIAFDLPTQMGYNSDNILSRGEVGRVGVAVNSLYDFERLFEDIALNQISTSMTINAPAFILLAMYIAVGEKQGVASEKLNGTVQNDILKEYIARGTYIFPPKPSLKLAVDIIEYCSKYLPEFNPISISGYHMREAGANAVQEVAFALANGITYVEEVIKRGIEVDSFAPRLSFFFASHNNFCEEIAKFRAARRLWAKIMKEQFHAKEPNSLKLRFHTQTAGVTLTAQQPEVNIIRVAYQALAAVLGGTQSLHTNSYDEALSLPTEESVRLALRTQQVLAYETGVSDIVDPLGGSFYIEQLTNKIEEQALRYIHKIGEIGGMPKAIEIGFIQKEIQENAYFNQKRIDNGLDKVIGINCFKTEEKPKIPLFNYEVGIENKEIESLKALKNNRDPHYINEKLLYLKKVAESNENIMPVTIDLIKAYATIQEICDVLKQVYGVYKSPEII